MSFLDEFVDRSVLLLGDIMLDEYLWGDVDRISPEAPVPVLEFKSRTRSLGGAANAAMNIVSLGGTAFLGAAVGSDASADAIRHDLVSNRIQAHLVTCPDRPTTTKTRLFGGSQQILRIDHEDSRPIPRDGEASLLDWMGRSLSSADCILISDYGKGVATHSLCRGAIELAQSGNKPSVVDPKGRDYSRYAGATVVTPNLKELRLAVDSLGFAQGDLEHDAARLRSTMGGTSVLVTRGAEGLSLFQPDEPPLHIAARVRNVYDVTGAGDTLAATLALALAAGARLEEAARVANIAAGIVVGRLGTATVDLAQLVTEFQASQAAPDHDSGEEDGRRDARR
jgi:D-beta-D-heptose 7-phosphate kinase/D-beta-D-heptose 1-phosphate adenosyltransferase